MMAPRNIDLDIVSGETDGGDNSQRDNTFGVGAGLLLDLDGSLTVCAGPGGTAKLLSVAHEQKC